MLDQTYPGWLNAVFDGLTAVGTIGVAVLAIWGEQLRSRFVPLSLLLTSHNLAGTLTKTAGGRPVYYYHLKVVNQTRVRAAKGCRVMLVGLHRRAADGAFHPEPLPVPLQFVWSPAAFTPTQLTVQRDQVVDFGFVLAPSQFQGPPPVYEPALYVTPNDFRGRVGPGEAIRYLIEIEAEDFVSEAPQVFEVSWQNGWSDQPAVMAGNLTIHEVSRAAA